MKMFKSKKKKKKKRLTRLLFFFFFMFSYVYASIYLNNHSSKKNILNNKFNYINTDVFKLIEESIDNVLDNPVNLLNSNVREVTKKVSSNNDVKKVNKVSTIDDYNPLIYIYNTHQAEDYSDYSVYELSAYLSDNLTKEKIDNYFEEQSINTFLSENNLKYYESYMVSRKYLTSALEKYNSLKYFIDIHRDSVSKSKATLNYMNKNYAKVLFIVGLDNNNYKENLNNTTILNNMIEEKIPGISRGIMKKQGKGVDGVYNQDLSPNLFLIEVGAKDSTKEEVINTINVIKDVIISYTGGIT